jgi:hypothetical protein
MNQTYEELNNFTNSLSAIPDAYAGKWDFSLYDNGATGGADYCFRVVQSNGSVLNTYTSYPQITTSTSTNTVPNAPTSLVQAKSDDTVITTGSWIDQTSVKFSASATDSDNPDTLALCVEKKAIATSFTNVEDSCGTAVSYTGSDVTITNTISSLTDATEYHWQVRVKDTAGTYSSWVSYGGNAESARDFGVDTTDPTALTVYDGTTNGTDSMFNNGTLDRLSANWDGLNANVAGLLKYEYSIGTSSGGTNIVNWTDNGTTTSVTVSSLTLQSSVLYYFNVRVTDNASNTAVFSSDGQRVLPSLSFSLSTNSVNFQNLNNGNQFSDTQNTTITTTTNAYNGYVIRLFKVDALRSTLYPAVSIGDFDGGTYANPATWAIGNYGFGYTSNDTTIQGANKFNAVTCPGGGSPPCFAPFSSTAPGDIIADHTSLVTGTPVSAEQFIITYKVKTPATQTSGPYNTTLVYTIIPQY